MGIYLDLENFDKLLAESDTDPIFINDFNTTTIEGKQKLNQLVTTKYENTDVLVNEAMCECGAITGTYNAGITCSNCNSVVTEPFEQELKPIMWIRSPKGIHGLINPIIWIFLTELFVVKHFSIVEWICNTDYHTPNPVPLEVNYLRDKGIVRGYNNFIDHFDEYLDILYSIPTQPFKIKLANDNLRKLIKDRRDCVISQYLPLINKSVMVIEKSSHKTYVDVLVIQALDAVRTISYIDDPLSTLKLRQKENRTIKTIIKLAGFYRGSFKSMFASKEGIFRKHIFGSRTHFSCRAVITSNANIKRYDELYLPWGAAITMLKMHLMNKLIRLNYTPNEATELLQRHTFSYSALIDSLFKEIISESRDGCFYVLFIRNPSSS